MATRFSMARDINGFNGFGLVPSDTNVSCTFTVSTDTTFTVPSNTSLGGTSTSPNGRPVWLAIFDFDPGASVWVAINATAAAPAGATFAATASMLNPAALVVYGATPFGAVPSVAADVIHCFTTGTGVSGSIRFYSLS